MLFFYSPLPPAKTGPADYLQTLLENMEREAGAAIKEKVTLLYDSAVAPEPVTLREMGWNIRDHKSILPSADDTRVYFLASNEHHYFIYDALHRHDYGRGIAVVHDLTAGFFLRGLSRFADSSVGEPGLLEAFTFDFGHRASAVIKHYEDIHQTPTYFIMAQGATIARTERVYVHSFYAKTRLLCESTVDVPWHKVRVAQFPRRAAAAKPAAAVAPCPKFRVSTLGFYTETKRYPSLVKAWCAFAAKLLPEDHRHIELIFGGAIDAEVQRALEDIIRGEPGRETVRFVGYLSDPDLDEIIVTSSLVINLRFPSCGETSAIVQRAIELGSPLVVSAFAGYHEEPAAIRITVDPFVEIGALTDAFEEAYALWQAGERLTNAEPRAFGPKRDLAREMIELAGA